MCCACGVPPPADLFASMGQVPPQSEPYPPLDPNLTASYQKPVMAESQFGFAAPDPLDLINSVLSVLHLGPSPRQPDDSGGLDTDGAASYERSLLETAAAAAAAGGDGLAAGKTGYEKAEILGLFDGFQMSRPIEDLFADISPSVSPCDLTIIAALLARADGMVDLTPNRLTQVVYFWRKIALILLTVALDPPGSEFLSAHDCIAQHVVEKSGKTRVGHGSVSCISPLEAVSAVVDWIISLRHIPLSFLQVSYPRRLCSSARALIYPCICSKPAGAGASEQSWSLRSMARGSIPEQPGEGTLFRPSPDPHNPTLIAL